MDAATSSDCNDNLTSSSTLSSNNAAAVVVAESAACRDRRHRARYGFGFRPPQAKQGRPGPARPTMPLSPTGTAVVVAAGDVATPEDDERPSVNGTTEHLANGVDDGRAATSTRGPPTTAVAARSRQKAALDVQRQTTNGGTKQSALRRPAQKASAASAQRQPVDKITASNGVSLASDHPAQALNGGHGKASAPPNGRRRPPSDKSVKLLVNYRSTNDRHAPLQSAYGNRDFFGSSSSSNPPSSSSSASTGAAVDAASAGCAVELPPSGSEDMKLAPHSRLSRSACSNCPII